MPRPEKKPKPAHRPMPEDPRQLAQAMFSMADRKTGRTGWHRSPPRDVEGPLPPPVVTSRSTRAGGFPAPRVRPT